MIILKKLVLLLVKKLEIRGPLPLRIIKSRSMLIQGAVRSKPYICGRYIFGVASSKHIEDTNVRLLCLLCVV
jgi:hypothetical protein